MQIPMMRAGSQALRLGVLSVLFVADIMFGQTKGAGRTVLDGVYTAAQAMRGEAAYGMSCAMCHEGADVDGPPLTGDPFIDRWREDKLDSLFTFIRTKMPRDAQGSLAENTYLDILAHLLEANNYPAGSKELTADTVKTTLLVGPDGPKPLPTNASIQAVGCMTAAAGNTWTLTSASDAARTRTETETSPEDLKAARSQPLGTATFHLQNLDFKPGFSPDSLKGHKVLAKGILVRQAGGDRINITALGDVAPACAQ
jgi:mono/diheme cytochrome c family protein